MDLLNVFQTMEKYEDTEKDYDYNRIQNYQQPRYTDNPVNNVVEDFERYNHSTMYYNLDGYISPHSYMNWGANSEVATSLIEDCAVPAFLDRLDPNQIFTSDMAELRKLATDQNKIVKMFERRLMESLTAQGKIGLDESDIEAMQALTAARSSITSMAKEKTNIKAKIAELKIKQQQVSNASNGSTRDGLSPQNPYASRSLLDNIFDIEVNGGSIPTAPANIPVPEIDPMSIPIGSLGEERDTSTTEFEVLKPTTKVLVDPTGDISTAEYVTYDQYGNEIPNYPNTPTVSIKDIDMSTERATNQIDQSFEIVVRKPLTDDDV